MEIRLTRTEHTDTYTAGILHTPWGHVMHTIELPWRDNKRSVSCIPTGRYQVRVTYSPTFKRRLPRLLDVPGRSGILIHRGNCAEDSRGCILPGMSKLGPGGVGDSRLAEITLVGALQGAERAGEEVWITVE